MIGVSSCRIIGWRQVGARNGDLVEGEAAEMPNGDIIMTGWTRIAGFSLADGRIPEYNRQTGVKRFILPETDYTWKE